ncbi:helix-turn-helix domain-containing protein [Streptomyces sp. NPDC127079]|uniref:helix-turn-helix domain-containing protein n=1 Tax=Streptomyces sp. NPDC127079 TaxID=3347132 RepID=UPI00364726D6
MFKRTMPAEGSYRVPQTQHFRIVVYLTPATMLRDHCDSGAAQKPCLPGDVSKTPPGRERLLSYSAGKSIEMMCLRLSMDVVDQFIERSEPGVPLRDIEQIEALAEPDPIVSAIAPEILAAQKAGLGDLYMDSVAQYLAAHLLTPRVTAEGPQTKTLSRRQTETLVSYMRSHLADPVRMDDLADLVGFSRFYFQRSFTATVGRTPYRYLTEMRIEAARHYLELGSETIYTVGRLCGFPNPDNFARMFRRHVGCTPSEYRRQRTMP